MVVGIVLLYRCKLLSASGASLSTDIMPAIVPLQNAKAGPGPRTKSLTQAAKKRVHTKRRRQVEEEKKMKALQQSVANFVRGSIRHISCKFIKFS